MQYAGIDQGLRPYTPNRLLIAEGDSLTDPSTQQYSYGVVQTAYNQVSDPRFNSVYASLLQSNNSSWQVIIKAVYGQGISNVLSSLPEELAMFSTSTSNALSMLIGSNDLNAGTNPSTPLSPSILTTNTTTLIAGLKSVFNQCNAANVPVYVLTLLPRIGSGCGIGYGWGSTSYDLTALRSGTAAYYAVSATSGGISITGGTTSSYYNAVLAAFTAGRAVANSGMASAPLSAAQYAYHELLWEQGRQAINAWIRANATTYGYTVVDVGADPNIGVIGSNWNTAYYHAQDLTHEDELSHSIISGYLQAALYANGFK